jgi:hypothetical protein
MSVVPGNFEVKLTLPEREQSRKRKDWPLEISKAMNIVKYTDYNLNIQYLPNQTEQPKNDEDYEYLVGVYLVVPLELKDISVYHQMLECERVEESIQRVKQQLTQFSDDDIISDEMKVNLICPIIRSYGSLRIPVRGFKCQHID